MKCPNCGAEAGNGNYCEYCGSQITDQMRREQEQINKKCCPRCGSRNVKYERENQGVIQEKNSRQFVTRTVAVCEDCGATWFTDKPVKKRKTWLWVLGWIFIFPLPLTIILVKKKDMNAILKIIIIVIAWLFYAGWAFSANTENDINSYSDNVTSTTSSYEQNSEYSTEMELSERQTQESTTLNRESETNTENNNATLGEKNALTKAKEEIEYMCSSEKSIRESLSFEGFTQSEIDYAISHCGADWNKVCAKRAKQDVEYLHSSRKALKEDLEFEGFTKEQIEYALKSVGY